eukprot:scaffold216847_cov14-Tisochrysis_lutea.AAC.1
MSVVEALRHLSTCNKESTYAVQITSSAIIMHIHLTCWPLCKPFHLWPPATQATSSLAVACIFLNESASIQAHPFCSSLLFPPGSLKAYRHALALHRQRVNDARAKLEAGKEERSQQKRESAASSAAEAAASGGDGAQAAAKAAAQRRLACNDSSSKHLSLFTAGSQSPPGFG